MSGGYPVVLGNFREYVVFAVTLDQHTPLFLKYIQQVEQLSGRT